MSAAESLTGERDRRRQLALFIAAVFLYWMALYLYVPTLPLYVQTKSNNLAMVGVVVSMYGLWQALIRLPLGIASDWLGRRKPFIVGGFFLAGLGAWIMSSSQGISGLVVGRAITGLAAGAWVPLVVVFSALYPPQEAVRATAVMTVVHSGSRILATAITGSLNEWGGYSLSFILAAVVAGLAILAVLPVRESRRPPKRPQPDEIMRLVTRRDVLLPSALNAVGQYASWAASYTFFPILARQLGAGDVVLSFMVSMNIAVSLAGNLLTTAVLKRAGSRRLLYLSFSLHAAGIGMAAVAGQLWLVFAAQVLVGLAAGIGYPIMMGLSIEQVEEEGRSTAMGLHQAVYAIGMFAGPWLSGILADAAGLRPMFAMTAAAVLVVGLAGVHQLVDVGRKAS